MDHIVEAARRTLEEIIEGFRRGKVGDNCEIDLVFPFGMRPKDLVRLVLRPHCRSDSIARLSNIQHLCPPRGESPKGRGEIRQRTSMRIESIWDATKPLAPVKRTR